MRIVILLGFGGYMLTLGTTVGYLFAAVCAVFLALTALQLYQTLTGR